VNPALRVFLAAVTVAASVIWAVVSVTVVLEGHEDGRTITLAGYQLAAEVAGALALLISGAGVMSAGWILRSYGRPRLAKPS
jgi:hypothetical protein